MGEFKGTPGPWRVIERAIPWSLESGKEGSHVERWIYTEWEHPQLKDSAPVVTLSTGIGLSGEAPIRMVSIREHDARLIAAAPALLEALLIAREFAAYAQAEPADLALIDAAIRQATTP